MNDADRRLLDLEDEMPVHTRQKDDCIFNLGLTRSRYYAAVSLLVVEPDVVREYPQLTKRLQRLSRLRTRRRLSRTF